MPKTIQKELNKINKIIHPKSRKMAKLTKQSKRISSREKSKLVHHMKQNRLGEKLLWFQNHLESDIPKYTPDMLKELIKVYLKRFEEELEQIALKHEVGHRKNRQHASREDIIKITVLQEEEEFNSCGIEVPDLLNPSQLDLLRSWNGELRFLQNFKLKRYSLKTLLSLAVKEQDTVSEEQKDIESVASSSGVTTEERNIENVASGSGVTAEQKDKEQSKSESMDIDYTKT